MRLLLHCVSRVVVAGRRGLHGPGRAASLLPLAGRHTRRSEQGAIAATDRRLADSAQLQVHIQLRGRVPQTPQCHHSSEPHTAHYAPICHYAPPWPTSGPLFQPALVKHIPTDGTIMARWYVCLSTARPTNWPIESSSTTGGAGRDTWRSGGSSIVVVMGDRSLQSELGRPAKAAPNDSAHGLFVRALVYINLCVHTNSCLWLREESADSSRRGPSGKREANGGVRRSGCGMVTRKYGYESVLSLPLSGDIHLPPVRYYYCRLSTTHYPLSHCCHIATLP